MTDLSTLKLGRAPVRDDERTLRLATYLDAPALPPAPRARDWLSKVRSWEMYDNDRIGDCVPAGAAHLITAWTANDGGPPVVPTDADVISAYTAIAGYDPATGAGDNGCVMLDALNYWRTRGIGGHRIGAYVRVDVRDHAQVKQAINLFGGLYCGAALPLAARSQLSGWLWRTSRGGPVGAYAPGSWGGHCIHVGAYKTASLSCTTWGRTMGLTWSWWDTYVEEAYAVLSPDWLGPDGKSPTGLDITALTADLARVAG